MANIAVKHDMTSAEREADRELRKQAKEKTVQLNHKNIKFVVRGPPWEREIIKMELKGKRLIPVMDQWSGSRSWIWSKWYIQMPTSSRQQSLLNKKNLIQEKSPKIIAIT